jgi:hypothetical protein
MKTKSILIILLILSLSFSPSLVTAYDYNMPVKLTEDEFNKRLQNYIDTPDELKVYVPDIVRENEEVDFMTLYDVSQKLNIPEKDKIINPEQPLMVKNPNAVVYDSAIRLRDYDTANRLGAINGFMKTYAQNSNAYRSLIYYGETVKNIKFLASNNLKLLDDNIFSGMDGLDPYAYIEIPGGIRMTNAEFLQQIVDAQVTWDGFLIAPARDGYRSFNMAVSTASQVMSDNYYLIENYNRLRMINNRLIAAGKPTLGEPSDNYQLTHFVGLNKLFSKNNPTVQYVKETMSDVHNPVGRFLTPAEPRPQDRGGEPKDIRPVTIIETYQNNGVPVEAAQTIFRERYTENFISKMTYYEGGVMIVFAIVMLILACIYK